MLNLSTQILVGRKKMLHVGWDRHFALKERFGKKRGGWGKTSQTLSTSAKSDCCDGTDNLGPRVDSSGANSATTEMCLCQ